MHVSSVTCAVGGPSGESALGDLHPMEAMGVNAQAFSLD